MNALVYNRVLMQKMWVGAVVLIVIAVIVFSSRSQKPSSTSSVPVESQITQEKQETMPTLVPTPAMTIDPKKSYTATLKTSKGDIVIELFADKTPITVNNFVSLSEKDFYNKTIFHRVISGFMIQGGDPEGTGRGGPGYRFNDEPFEGDYKRGIVAMANAGPNTNGSQFFIMHADYRLPKNYVIFGEVTKGIEVVDIIATAPVRDSGEGSTPQDPVTINSVTITVGE